MKTEPHIRSQPNSWTVRMKLEGFCHGGRTSPRLIGKSASHPCGSQISWRMHWPKASRWLQTNLPPNGTWDQLRWLLCPFHFLLRTTLSPPHREKKDRHAQSAAETPTPGRLARLCALHGRQRQELSGRCKPQEGVPSEKIPSLLARWQGATVGRRAKTLPES